MNKKILLLPMGLLAVLLVSCNWQVPEKISVSTKASYNFSLGDIDSGEKLGTVGSMLGKNMQSASGSYVIYDYQPDETDSTQQFAIEMPLINYDLDFGQYLSNMDFEDNMEEMSIEPINIGPFDFSIPSISQNINIDSVNTTINEMVVIYAKSGIDSTIKMSMDTGNDFSSIIYDSGKLNLSVYLATDFTDLSTADFDNISVSTAAKSGTVTVNGSAAEITNGTGYLDLNGFVINKEGMSVSDDLGIGYVIIGRVDESSVVRQVSGLTMQDSLTRDMDETTVLSATDNSGLKSCVISEGSALIGLTAPSTWKNVTINGSFQFNGGLKDSLGNYLVLNNGVRKSLENVSYVNEDVSVKPSLSLKFDNSTIVFADEPEMTADFSITKVSQATVSSDSLSGMETSKEINQGLDESVTSLLKRIAWNEAGLEVTYTNSLPEGNDINVTLNSGFFGLDSIAKTISSGVTDEITESWTTKNHTTLIGNEAGEYNAIDFNFAYSLPGWNEQDRTLTVKNIELGKTYTIEFIINPVIDWASVTIDNSKAGIADTMGVSFSLKDTLSQLGDASILESIGLDSLPLYLFCDFGNLTEVLNNPKFSGKVSAYPAESSEDENGEITYSSLVDDSSKTWLIGSASSEGVITNCAVPELAAEESDTAAAVEADVSSEEAAAVDSSGEADTSTDSTASSDSSSETSETVSLPVSTFDLKKYAEEKGITSVELASLVDSLMEAGDTIGLDYNLKLSTDSADSEITVSKAQLDAIKENGSTTIDVSAVLVLPLKLNIKKDIDVDNILPLAGISYEDNPQYDILQRSSVSDYENIKTYAEAIDKAYVKCKNIELPLKMEENKEINFTIDLDGAGTAFEGMKLDLKNMNVEVSPYDLLNTYPLQPTVAGNIPEGTLSISRNLTIGANISLGLSCSGKPIVVWTKNKAEE